MAVLPTPPYKQFLTPALHRTFTGAAVVILAICYGEAVLIGEKTSFFWSWFPLGTVSIKTLLLFLSALSIFVLRVAQLHLGARTTPSYFATLTQNLVSLKTPQTIAWYIFSAWWFSEVYVWSASTNADLGWITLGKSWERRKLNERLIYLRSVFLLFAILQSVLHLYHDYDCVPLSQEKPARPETTVEAPLGTVAYIQQQCIHLIRSLQPLFWYDRNHIALSMTRNIILRAVFVSCMAPFLYGIFIRQTAWSWSLFFAALIWDIPISGLSFIPPHYPSLVLRSISSGFCLVLLWESSNVLFTSYVNRMPIKKGHPLTAESKDPNGSLLNGLKSRKEIPKTFALWELSHIAAHTSLRRKSLFTDIDRPSGPLWAQISKICLSNINAIQTRITPPPVPQTSNQSAQLELLPRIAPPLRQDPNIFARPTVPSSPGSKIQANVGAIAKSWGQSPSPGAIKLPPSVSNTLSPKRLLSSTSTGQKLLTQGSSAQPTGVAQGLLPRLHTYTMLFLRSSFGVPFRRTLARRACGVILGAPTSSLHPLLSSIRILSDLSAASLTEDPYGKVAKDVPMLIRTFVATIRSIEAFIDSLEPDWTDVEGQAQTGKRQIPEIDMVVTALKEGLGLMIQGFGKFAGELGMGEGEIVISRQIAGLEG